MQHPSPSAWSMLMNGLEHTHNPSRLYPTPPESTDGGLESSGFPTLLGLTQPPTPMLYEHSYPSSPEELNTMHGAIINETSGDNEDTEQVLSVSTSFYPGSHPLESDLTVASSDRVLFYVHSSTISDVSPDALKSLLHFSPVPGAGLKNAGVINIPLPAIVLTIIFHTIYGTSCAQYSPSTDDIIIAVDTLPSLGVNPAALIKPQTPLYTVLLSHAPLRPMDLYALAAHHRLAELAEHVSGHLISYPLHTIDDATAKHIGGVYLKRLFFLHMKRMRAVKEILMRPPTYHPVSRQCKLENQKKVTRAWALGATYIAWDTAPDLSTHRIQSVFEPLTVTLACKECQEMLKKRIKEAIVSWAAVKTTISE